MSEPDRSEKQSLLLRWTQAAQDWRETRQLLRGLGSASTAEREAAIEAIAQRGPSGAALLRHALSETVEIACGAAGALARQGEFAGIRLVLQRCAKEEIVSRCLFEGHIEGLAALRRLGHGNIGLALDQALDALEQDISILDAAERLYTVSGALNVLNLFVQSPRGWWLRALQFVRPASPERATPSWSKAGLLPDWVSMDWRDLQAMQVRFAALDGLIREYPSDSGDLLLETLASANTAAVVVAIHGLVRLRDHRAVPRLQAIAFMPDNPLANTARRGLESLAGSQADALTLLRASQVTNAAELLHPAMPTAAEAVPPEHLLRPTANE